MRFKSVFLVVLILCVLCFPYNTFAKAEVYDVVLFFGQSNMTGYAGINENDMISDSRINNNLNDYSNQTGIDMDILSNYTAINHVNVPIESGTAYEYLAKDSNMREITRDTIKLGEKIKYNGNTFSTDAPYALEESYGTNMIPQFVKTYYEKTHRKLIVVMASNGGEEIGHFAKTFECHDDDQHANQHIYETMTKKYQAAIKYMSDHPDKYIIGKKFYIIFQGESDAWNVNANGKYIYDNNANIGYYDVFMKVHNSLKEDLGLEYGGIVYTGQRFQVSSNLFDGVVGVHTAQKNLINNNSDIFLASSYPYSRYYSFMKENKSDYCISPNDGDKIHFTSAALSQIGMDSAISSVKQLNKNVNWLNSLKINGESITVGSNTTFKVNVGKDIDKVTIDAGTYHTGLTFVEDFGPRDVDIVDGENTILLKVKYGSQQKLYTIVVNKERNEKNDDVIVIDTPKEEKESGQVVMVEDTFAKKSIISLIVSLLLILIGFAMCIYTNNINDNDLK